MIPKRLTREDVSFEIRTEPDESDVRGSFASGEPEYEQADREIEDGIIRRLNAGDHEAWCGVIVEARYGKHLGGDSIWGNSLTESYTAESVVEEHGMLDNALASLQKEVDRAALKRAGRAVLSELETIPESTLRGWVSRGFSTVAKLARLEMKRRELAKLVTD
jgi:hypothetical protein